ncbi:MAG: sarcosine oxidase [Candidatus Poriferisodalaceae bacterium]|jgi:sarcosine oxidase
MPYDLIVVGLGAMGSAALFHAARSGMKVLGIDRYDPPHSFGSSHAESRVTRLAVGEGSQYLPFVARSHDIWRDLEAETGREMLFLPGCYIICDEDPVDADRWGNFVARTDAVASAAGIDFEIRSHEEFARHLPSVNLFGHELLGFEPNGGIVLSDVAVATQLELARATGADTLINTEVTGIVADSGGVSVTAGGHTIRGSKVIVSTGGWFADLVPPSDGAKVDVTRQVVQWFEVDDPSVYGADCFPSMLWSGKRTDDYIGVFPMVPGGVPGLKVLTEQFDVSTHPESVDRQVTREEIADFHARLIAPRLGGVSDRCVKAEVCLYTNTPDEHFLIDFAPDSEHVLFASPCSGHGFKHSTALGEAMVQLVTTGSSDLDLSPFRRDRFST